MINRMANTPISLYGSFALKKEINVFANLYLGNLGLKYRKYGIAENYFRYGPNILDHICLIP